MKNTIIALILFAVGGLTPLQAQSITKPKVIVTTDMGADPDDEQSMVRFLVQSNEFNVLGLIVATGCWKTSQSTANMNKYMDPLLNGYEKAYNNLKVHSADYPTPAYLKSVTVLGNTAYGYAGIGSGKDSPGSNLIIKAVDAATPDNPVGVQSWGGSNTVAQALWTVKNTRTQAQVDEFISKLYIYDILGQDDAGAWIAVTFPNLTYIRATDVYSWQRNKSDGWWATNIQSHGPLGAVYPDGKYAMEGDTPAFLWAVGRGLNNPADPKQRGWGGQFISKKSNIESMSQVAKISNEKQWGTYYMYGNSLGPQEFKQAIENDFQARMDWANTSNYSSANHHPVVVVNGDGSEDILEVFAAPGTSLTLSAEGTTDPDNNTLSYKWSHYQTDGTYGSAISITNSTSKNASITVPSNSNDKTMHFVVAVSDNGSPSLTSYRRVIVKGGSDPDDSPTIKITVPQTGESVNVGETVNIEATASAKIGTITQVEFFVDAVSIGVDKTYPYTASYENATNGTHSIQAKATDSQNKTATVSIQLNVDSPPGPYQGVPHAIPGVIEFEHFDEGKNGSAYFDDSPGSETKIPFRTDTDVDFEICTDVGAGYNIGYATAGEWFHYTISVPFTGSYNLSMRVAVNGDNRTLSVDVDGTSAFTQVSVPNTGGWQTWQDLKIGSLHLTAGLHVIRVTIGNEDYVNLNNMSLLSEGSVNILNNHGIKNPITVNIHSNSLEVSGASPGSMVKVYNIKGTLLSEFGHTGGSIDDRHKGILLISVVSPTGSIQHFREKCCIAQ